MWPLNIDHRFFPGHDLLLSNNPIVLRPKLLSMEAKSFRSPSAVSGLGHQKNLANNRLKMFDTRAIRLRNCLYVSTYVQMLIYIKSSAACCRFLMFGCACVCLKRLVRMLIYIKTLGIGDIEHPPYLFLAIS